MSRSCCVQWQLHKWLKVNEYLTSRCTASFLSQIWIKPRREMPTLASKFCWIRIVYLLPLRRKFGAYEQILDLQRRTTNICENLRGLATEKFWWKLSVLLINSVSLPCSVCIHSFAAYSQICCIYNSIIISWESWV